MGLVERSRDKNRSKFQSASAAPSHAHHALRASVRTLCRGPTSENHWLSSLFKIHPFIVSLACLPSLPSTLFSASQYYCHYYKSITLNFSSALVSSGCPTHPSPALLPSLPPPHSLAGLSLELSSSKASALTPPPVRVKHLFMFS